MSKELECVYDSREKCLGGPLGCHMYCMLGHHAPVDKYVTKDSGEREEFETGSRRDSRAGKGRYDLLPFRALRRIAGVYERGAEKYGDRNWELGQPQSRYLDSALRHLGQYAVGDVDEDHLAQAAFNVLAMIDQEERNRTDMMDLPHHGV